jgi:hypothetical protein
LAATPGFDSLARHASTGTQTNREAGGVMKRLTITIEAESEGRMDEALTLIAHQVLIGFTSGFDCTEDEQYHYDVEEV